MRAGLVLRHARSTTFVAAVSAVAAGWFAAPALADTPSTITVANATATAEQAVPVDLTFSGTNALTGSAEVEAIVRPAGGLACQSSYQDDVSAVGGEDVTIFGPGAQTVPPGTYQLSASFKPPTPSSYQVCAWLQQNQGGTDQVVPGVAPGTVSFTARSPQVTQLTITVPKDLTPRITFQIGYTTQTDQPLELFSVIKKAGGLPCATSFELESQQSQQATMLLGIGSPEVFGGPATTTVATKENTGSYLICTWVEGPNAQQVDRSDSTAVTVGTPVAPPPPKPGLKLTRVSASRRHGVSVVGATAAGFSGRLVVAASCGSSTAKHSATARNRHFSANVGLPSGCRKARRVKVTVSWAGSSGFAKQSATKSVAIGK
jgi:hypothetical protein